MSHRLIQLGMALFMLISMAVLPGWLAAAGGEVRWLLEYLPWVLLGAAGLVSFVYGLKKLSFMVMVCLGAYALIRNDLQVPLPQGDTELKFWGLCLIAPLLVFLYDKLPERWLLSGYYLSALMVALLPSGLFYHYLSSDPAGTHQMLAGWFEPLGGYPAPWLALLLMGLYFAICALSQNRRQDKGDSAALLCLMALALTSFNFDVPGISSLMFTCLGVLLLVVLVLHSYRLAFYDLLTGVRNRRSLDSRLKGVSGRYQVAMVDIDHFKSFNDTFGHDVGDDVLRLVAQRLSKVGAGGTVYRYGGEEFTIVFPSRDRKRCLEALEAIRLTIADYPFYVRDKQPSGPVRRRRREAKPKTPPQTITVSMGLAQARFDDANAEAVIKRADEALYQAKEAGRNCIRADATPSRRPARRRAMA
ncbi:GGDEF domain-containing protein [Ferrimonas sp.]|uniref:GGDEF domain-containing protein n=1 Tax=Ferrimonas sp. TaxID=2080861 RepID=UPI003A8D8BE7